MSVRPGWPPATAASRQKGAALLITLILLAAITFLSVSAFNAGTANLRSVANSEARVEATSAAQAAIDWTISSTRFATQPAEVAAGSIGVDLDGDGANDYQPVLDPAPACTQVAPLRMTDLDPANAADLACMGSSVSRTSGIDSRDAATEAGKSLCASSQWAIRAQASHARTGVQVALVQGVGMRILETDSQNFCK